jgi:uncharacterized membrane protein YuzA (DUF378 family)
MKRTALNLMAALMLALVPAGVLAGSAYAACSSNSQSGTEVLNGISKAGPCDESGITSTISTAVQILSVVAGIAAVIMVIISGFRYITSGGDSGKVGNAKNSLIYALVGIAIVVLAQFLVHFVINNTSNATTPCPSNPAITKSNHQCK